MRVIRLFIQVRFLKYFLVIILVMFKYVGKIKREKYEILSKGKLIRKIFCLMKKLLLKVIVGWEIY